MRASVSPRPPSLPAFDGDLLSSEEPSSLARVRYASTSWLSTDDVHTRDELNDAVDEVVARFAAIQAQVQMQASHAASANASQNHATSTSHAHPPASSSAASTGHHSPSPSPTPPPLPVIPDSLSLLFPPPPPCPVLPTFSSRHDLGRRARLLQSYLRAFEYNHLGHEFHPVKKTVSFSRLMSQAREMMREALPIKCLEAVAIATWVTREWRDAERMPLRFKTKSGGRSYWHIVLALVSGAGGEGGVGARFGSVGLSRRCTLDYRPVVYPSLSALVDSFRVAYAEVGHEMHVITVGLPMPRKEFAPDRVHWHFLQMPVRQIHSRMTRASGTTTAATTTTTIVGAMSVNGTAASPSPPPPALVDAGVVEREWSMTCEILDQYARIAPRLVDLVRKCAGAAGSSATTSNATNGAGQSLTGALFIPPAALRALGPLHPHCAYDSALVALVHRPSWCAHTSTRITRRVDGRRDSSATAAGGGGGSSAVLPTTASSASEESGASGSEDHSSDSDSADELDRATRTNNSNNHNHAEEGELTSRRAKEEQKSATPTTIMPSRKSAAAVRRAVERADRRRARALVQALLGRYRVPPSTFTPSGAAVAASPAVSVGSPTTPAGKKRPSRTSGGSVASPPTRSPQVLHILSHAHARHANVPTLRLPRTTINGRAASPTKPHGHAATSATSATTPTPPPLPSAALPSTDQVPLHPPPALTAFFVRSVEPAPAAVPLADDDDDGPAFPPTLLERELLPSARAIVGAVTSVLPPPSLLQSFSQVRLDTNKAAAAAGSIDAAYAALSPSLSRSRSRLRSRSRSLLAGANVDDHAEIVRDAGVPAAVTLVNSAAMSPWERDLLVEEAAGTTPRPSLAL